MGVNGNVGSSPANYEIKLPFSGPTIEFKKESCTNTETKILEMNTDTGKEYFELYYDSKCLRYYVYIPDLN